MVLHTVLRDCLHLNWALPRTALSPPPEPLRYEVHRHEGGEWVFVSVLLFQQDGLRSDLLPVMRLSYPQCNLRSYVIDGEGVPSVLFQRLLVPAWVTPCARLATRVPCQAARLRYPRPSRAPQAESWRWDVAKGERRFAVEARQGAPAIGCGPDLGDWEKTTAYFRRDRGYVPGGERLRRIDIAQRVLPVWPMRAEIGEESLLTAAWPGAGEEWPALHSAWLCPETAFSVETAPARNAVVPRQVPAPG